MTRAYDLFGDPTQMNPAEYFELNFFMVARRLEELYVNAYDRYVLSVPCSAEHPDGLMTVPKSKNGVPIPLKNKAICGHLNRKFAICIFGGPYSSKFICFDVDDGSHEAVKKVIDGLEALGIPRDHVYVSQSGGKGYHVEVFFAEKVYNNVIKSIYDGVIGMQGLDPAKVELRPTATQAIKLPLSIHRKTKKMCWFCDPDTLEPIETQMFLFDIQQISREDAVSASIRADWKKPVSEKPKCEPKIDYSAVTGYPDITEDGQRHQMMMRIALAERYRGATLEEAYAAMASWWDRQDKTLCKTDKDDAIADGRSLVDWAYSVQLRPRKKRFDDPSVPGERIVFDAGDMRLILSQPTKTRRKLMFLTLRGRKRWGHYQCMCATQEQLADVCGVKRLAVRKAFDEMAAEGWVKIIRQRTKKTSSGNMVARPNKYVVTYEAEAWARPPHAPFEHGDDKILQTHLLLDTLVVNDEVERNPMEDYHRVLKEFLSEKDMKKFLTAKELEELENGNEDYEGTHRGDQVGQQQVPDGLSAEHGCEQRQGEVQEHPADLCA